MGEFGAVSVVSGHIRGETNTLPLHVEILYNEYQFAAAFACASLLALLALVTLALKFAVERRAQRERSLQGTPHEHRAFATSTSASATSSPSTTSTSTSRPASCSRCSAPRAPARRRCCGSSRASSRRTRAPSSFHGEDATDTPRARAPGRLRVPALRAEQYVPVLRARRTSTVLLKMYIGGKQVRPDGNYTRAVLNSKGKVIGQVGDGNRKDIRDAVEAAHAAHTAKPGWAMRHGYNRSQILYFIGENLDSARRRICQADR